MLGHRVALDAITGPVEPGGVAPAVGRAGGPAERWEDGVDRAGGPMWQGLQKPLEAGEARQSVLQEPTGTPPPAHTLILTHRDSSELWPPAMAESKCGLSF